MNRDKKIKVNLNKISDIKNFIEIVNSFKSDIDIITGRFVIDAKSLMGIFSLDLSKDIYVSINTDNEEENNRFEKAMEEFNY